MLFESLSSVYWMILQGGPHWGLASNSNPIKIGHLPRLRGCAAHIFQTLSGTAR